MMGLGEAGTYLWVPGASLGFFRFERFYHGTALLDGNFCSGWNFNPNFDSHLSAAQRGCGPDFWMGYGQVGAQQGENLSGCHP